jgi:hypothetical protein
MNDNDRPLEASLTVVEAMARTEAILRHQAEARAYQAVRVSDPRSCPRRYRRGLGAWLASWRARVSAWTV